MSGIVGPCPQSLFRCLDTEPANRGETWVYFPIMKRPIHASRNSSEIVEVMADLVRTDLFDLRRWYEWAVCECELQVHRLLGEAEEAVVHEDVVGLYVHKLDRYAKIG